MRAGVEMAAVKSSRFRPEINHIGYAFFADKADFFSANDCYFAFFPVKTDENAHSHRNTAIFARGFLAFQKKLMYNILVA